VNLSAMLKKVQRATVPLDARRVGDRAYLADREVRCCKAILAIVGLVPALVVKRDALREELARLRHRDASKAYGPGKRAEIDAEREQVESALRAGAQAVAKLRNDIADIGRLQRAVPTKPGQRCRGTPPAESGEGERGNDEAAARTQSARARARHDGAARAGG